MSSHFKVLVDQKSGYQLSVDHLTYYRTLQAGNSLTHQTTSDEVVNSVSLELFGRELDPLFVEIESVEVAAWSHRPDEAVRQRPTSGAAFDH